MFSPIRICVHRFSDQRMFSFPQAGRRFRGVRLKCLHCFHANFVLMSCSLNSSHLLSAGIKASGGSRRVRSPAQIKLGLFGTRHEFAERSVRKCIPGGLVCGPHESCRSTRPLARARRSRSVTCTCIVRFPQGKRSQIY